jgi:hypothetical protein
MLAESEIDYKRTLDKTQRKYRQNWCRRLKNMRTKDPKEFWKILNQGKRKTQPNISLQKLFEFFKNLNTAPSDDIGDSANICLFISVRYLCNFLLSLRYFCLANLQSKSNQARFPGFKLSQIFRCKNCLNFSKT